MTNLKPTTELFANRFGYSDVEPWQIIRVISDKTIEIRLMNTSENKTKMDFEVGGFAAHCKNQDEQEYDFFANEQNPTVKARLRKDGYFHSLLGRHVISEKPTKFHDYNF